jgi:DivIVA domain-containing protein
VTLIHLLIVLAVVAGVAAVAAGKVRGGLPEPTSTRPDVELPEQDVAPQDVDAIRFSVGFRGYRMDEVDEVLDRLGLELGAREEEIRQLREHLAGGPETLAAPTEPIESTERTEPTESIEPADRPSAG